MQKLVQSTNTKTLIQDTKTLIQTQTDTNRRHWYHLLIQSTSAYFTTPIVPPVV